MDRDEMVRLINGAFEEYADGRHKMPLSDASLDHLHGRVLMVISEFCDDIAKIINETRELVDKIH